MLSKISGFRLPVKPSLSISGFYNTIKRDQESTTNIFSSATSYAALASGGTAFIFFENLQDINPLTYLNLYIP